jgi:uncharacterized ferredoxin-like protein
VNAHDTEVVADALERCTGLPVPTPAEFAQRLDEQLRKRGYVIVGPQEDDCSGLGCTCCGKLWNLVLDGPQPVDEPVEGS